MENGEGALLDEVGKKDEIGGEKVLTKGGMANSQLPCAAMRARRAQKSPKTLTRWPVEMVEAQPELANIYLAIGEVNIHQYSLSLR